MCSKVSKHNNQENIMADERRQKTSDNVPADQALWTRRLSVPKLQYVTSDDAELKGCLVDSQNSFFAAFACSIQLQGLPSMCLEGPQSVGKKHGF